jgi:hypothetical protein
MRWIVSPTAGLLRPDPAPGEFRFATHAGDFNSDLKARGSNATRCGWSRYLCFMAGSCGYLLIALYVVYDYQFKAADAPPPRWQSMLRTAFMP